MQLLRDYVITGTNDLASRLSCAANTKDTKDTEATKVGGPPGCSRIPNSEFQIPNCLSLYRRLLLKQRLAAQSNFSGRIDVDHFDQELFSFLQLVPHVLHAMVRDFRDVQQAVGARHDLDKGAEVGDALDLAQVHLVQFGGR